jgi:hypothetical protein
MGAEGRHQPRQQGDQRRRQGSEQDADGLRRLHELKTGRLIGASVRIPLILADVGEPETIRYRRFADELGVLLQIVDDILDVTGSDEALGKPRGSDERHGKLTYVSLFVLERARELATLRVLGFSRAEVSWILIGEIAVLTLLAVPVGWLVGTGFALLLSQAMAMDMFRVPFIITPQTYAFSAAGVLLASVLSMLAIWRLLGTVDMLAALKTSE